MFRLTELDRRRIANFRANRRAIWALRLFAVIFTIALCAEVVANDRPIAVKHDGEWLYPIWNEYPESRFGGDEGIVKVDYHDPVIQCLIRTGAGIDPCLDEADGIARAEVPEGKSAGWLLWPPIPYSYSYVDKAVEYAPYPPGGRHWLGTDDQARDVVAKIIYGFRLSVLFGFAVALVSAVIGIFLGALQGFFGGWVDLSLQRFEEIWTSLNRLYVILIIAAVITPTPLVLFCIFIAFSWTDLTGVVRAEFLRARNFEYVQAARALGVSDFKIMFRHILPNAMVATITLLPFVLTGSIGLLTGLDFLGFGLGSGYPSLGELALQGNRNPAQIWLALTAFGTFVVMLSLLVFIFEGIRDAFDPRKTFG